MERRIVWKKSLKLDEDFFKEIDEIYNFLNMQPEYIIETKEKATYKYENTELLLKGKFDEEVLNLSIQPQQYDLKNKIYFYFEVYNGVIFNYDEVAICKYTIENDEKDVILRDKINKLYRNHTKTDWLIGKIGLSFIIYILTFICSIYGMFLLINDKLKITTETNIYTNMYILSMSIITILLIKQFDTYMCKKIFSPIVYYLGYQKEKWNRMEKLRSNILWGILISLLVGIIGSYIYSHL